MKQTDEGIFLHRTAFSESSLIATFYTRQHGLRKFVFKGGKKKAHQLFPLASCELTFYGRIESDLLQLTAVEADLHTEFQFDPVKSTIAFFLAECVRKCVHEHDGDVETFRFLQQTVSALNTTENCSIFPITFLVSFAELLGMQPLVSEAGTVFDLDEGLISSAAQPGHRTSQGEHIRLLVDCIQGEPISNTPRHVRESALETLMLYYTIHVARLKQFETFEIVREILSA